MVRFALWRMAVGAAVGGTWWMAWLCRVDTYAQVLTWLERRSSDEAWSPRA